ncbi:hypothetical protein Agub_g13053, partial [Astrephomene gubernaculifera]
MSDLTCYRGAAGVNLGAACTSKARACHRMLPGIPWSRHATLAPKHAINHCAFSSRSVPHTAQHPQIPVPCQPLSSTSSSSSSATTLASSSNLHARRPHSCLDKVPYRYGCRTTIVAASTAGGKSSNSGSSSDATGAATTAAVAKLATAAVAGAVAAAAPPPPPRTTAIRLVQRTIELLRPHFLAMLLLYGIRDAAAFVVHRLTQRLTNHVAEVLLGVPTSSAGNPWWLFLDPAFIRAHPGYEVLVGFFFLASLPLTIALNAVAFSVATLVCAPPEVRVAVAGGVVSGGDSATAAAAAGDAPVAASAASAALADIGIVAVATTAEAGAAATSTSAEAEVAAEADASAVPLAPTEVSVAAEATEETTSAATEASGGGDGGGFMAALRAALQSLAAALPAAAGVVRRVWWADLHLNARALPLQGLCLLVLPALWAAPRLVQMQLALPVAAIEGGERKEGSSSSSPAAAGATTAHGEMQQQGNSPSPSSSSGGGTRQGAGALARSRELMRHAVGAYGGPFAALLAAGRLLEYVQGLVFAALPPRWWREVVELPLLLGALFLLGKAAVQRLQDLLPLATYMELTEQQQQVQQMQQAAGQLVTAGSSPLDSSSKEQSQQSQQSQQETQRSGGGAATSA